MAKSVMSMAAVTALLAVSFAGTTALGPAAAPAAAAPGTPGIPQPSSVIYTEDFQNVAGPAPILKLNEYAGATGHTYTADSVWLTDCNGTIASAAQSTTDSEQVADCRGSQGSWNSAQQLAEALGQYTGAASLANYAVSAFTAGNPGAGAVEFATASNIPFTGNGRFVAFSVDVAAVNCQVSPPLLQFQLVNDAGAATNAGSQVNACSSTETVQAPAVGVTTSRAINVGTSTSNGAVLVNGTSVGVRMLNNNGSGTGNDHAFDNIQILDVTPQLDKSFAPASVPQGQVSTLTLTVTNTEELASKNGWSFTDALPAGLSVAGNASTTCAAGVVTAPAGATSVSVTGNLNAGQASCTITVNVIADAPGSYTNGPDNITGTGINPPAVSTVEFTSVPFQCDASGYLFQNPSPGVNLMQRVDLVTGEYETAHELPTTVNAVGYNTLDNFFYGIEVGTGSLLRIGSDGSVTGLGVPAGMAAATQIVGDFDANGHYWVSNVANAAIYEIDLVPGSATYGTVVGTGTRALPAGMTSLGADWGFTNNAFYSIGSSSGVNALSLFDPATGTETAGPAMTFEDGTPVAGLGVGAVYVDAAGYLYGSNNATGNIYRVDVTTGQTILLAAGPSAAGNDGARCATAPIPTLTVTKTVENRQAPADQFTVGIVDPTDTVQAEATTTGTQMTVSTVDQPVSQGATYTITDTMAAGSASAINAYTTGIACLNATTGAVVPAEGTGPWTVTIPAAADFTCEVTNTAVPVGFDLVKTADEASQQNIEAGQEITYSFEFRNEGDVPLTDIRIDETEFSGTGAAPVASCPSTTVGAGESVTCTATYVVTQADIDAGGITNTATGTGTPPPGFPPLPPVPSNEVIVPHDPVPGISVVKSADAEALKDIEVGQEVTYSFLVKNTGNVTLADVSVTEGEFTGSGELSGVTCPAGAGSLAPGAEVLCIATYTITQADVDAGTVTNTATATGTPPGTTTPPVSPPSTVTVAGTPAPAVTVVKSADTAAQDAIAVGQNVTYSFLVTNTGNVTLNEVTVTEGEFTGSGDLSDVACPAGSLAPGASVTCTAGYTITQADVDAGTVTNTATVTGTPPGGITPPPVSPPSTVTVPGDPAPGLAIVKTASAEDVTAAGQDITYSFVLTNTGNLTLTDVTAVEGEFTGTGNLTDVLCPDGAASLAPGAQVTCTATYTTTQADVDTGTITNTATGTGTPPNNEEPIVTDPSTSTVEFTAQPGISVVKSADAEARNDLRAGQNITYSFVLTNTGNVTLTDVTAVEGEFTGAGNLSEVTCPADAASLAPGASVTCTATYTVVQADVDTGTITNTATGTGTPARGEVPVSPVSEVQVPSAAAPALTVVKTASADAVTAAGQDITYSFLLTNTGNVTLTDVTAVEGEFTGAGNLSEVTCPAGAASLAPGASVTCAATYTTTAADLAAGTITNTATGTATIPGGGTLGSEPSTATITTIPVLTPEEPATQNPAPPAKDALANTGLTTGPLALGGLALLLLGAGTLAATKHRRRQNI